MNLSILAELLAEVVDFPRLCKVLSPAMKDGAPAMIMVAGVAVEEVVSFFIWIKSIFKLFINYYFNLKYKISKFNIQGLLGSLHVVSIIFSEFIFK